MNQLLADPPVDVGFVATPPGAAAFNPGAVGRAAIFPNVLTSGPRSQRNFIAGVQPENVLFSFPSGEVVAAVWDAQDLAGGPGHLSLYMTGALFEDAAYGPIRENLQAFLERSAPRVLPRVGPVR